LPGFEKALTNFICPQLPFLPVTLYFVKALKTLLGEEKGMGMNGFSCLQEKCTFSEYYCGFGEVNLS